MGHLILHAGKPALILFSITPNEYYISFDDNLLL